ncbi:MAG: hypothetical protein PWQ59_919 [Thermoanaerobacterium sp.]|nr:hypothetical protein [Thermoanaerobacterium sp.]
MTKIVTIIFYLFFFILNFIKVCRNLTANSISMLLLENVIINIRMTKLEAITVNCISMISPHLRIKTVKIGMLKIYE